MEKIKTPSLLGVWATAPYFHDGSIKNLEELIKKTTFNHERKLEDYEIKNLATFIRSIDKYEKEVN